MQKSTHSTVTFGILSKTSHLCLFLQVTPQLNVLSLLLECSAETILSFTHIYIFGFIDPTSHPQELPIPSVGAVWKFSGTTYSEPMLE